MNAMLCGTMTTLPTLDTKVIPFRGGRGEEQIRFGSYVCLGRAHSLEEGALSVSERSLVVWERKGKEDRIAIFAL